MLVASSERLVVVIVSSSNSRAENGQKEKRSDDYCGEGKLHGVALFLV
jgi:hypothetical protein